jgi:stage II sporulation protein D
MIQSADQIVFACDRPFRTIDFQGQAFLNGEAKKDYVISLKDGKPAEVRYRVRLAIAESRGGAEQLRLQLANRQIRIKLWRPGLVLKIGNRQLDNREFWIVTRPFPNQQAAADFARDYQPVGEAVVVKDILQPAIGRLQVESHEVTQGLRIVPDDSDCRIRLADVPVGIEFHWQHQRTQELPGILEVRINNDGKLTAINELDIEDYLISVNSSEMTAENPPELLKAQTIAARSTILATMGKHHYSENFHLCSDDHCQCYHGMANISEASMCAARDTLGENLMHGKRVCDARYAKICGGVMEDYRNVWDNRSVPYLVAGIDGKDQNEHPLAGEEEVKAYINSSPDVFCNTLRHEIASPLPYDTAKLFRWKVSYAREELQEIIHSKIGTDIGHLIDLIPGERGTSGRLIWLDIVGSKQTVRIAKELMIRRTLSKSHLYSACFYIESDRGVSGIVSHYHLIGAGWGHGVGLCQVGATVMAQEGYDYKAILSHYYKNAILEKLY